MKPTSLECSAENPKPAWVESRRPSFFSILHFFLFWAPVLAYTGLLFYFSSQTGLQTTHDKLAHTAAYGLLGLLLGRAVNHTFSLSYFRLVIWVLLFSTLYGISDEIHQAFVPGRECSGWDMLADTAGSVLGVLFYVLLHHLQRPASEN